MSPIEDLDSEISEVEVEIDSIMSVLNSPLTEIPVVGHRIASMILVEIGDITRFSSLDQILAYAGISPSTYQSGQHTSSYSHMEKHDSKYIRYALFNASKYVCKLDFIFFEYLAKKRAEGKHYTVAIYRAAKKLVRLIYALETSGESYSLAT